MTNLIIAEKPSAARDIAKVAGATEKGEGCIRGNGNIVTWAFGHLIGLADMETYTGEKKWSKDELPFIPDNFELVLNKDAKAQFKIICQLMKEADVIVNATDAGREGELIFRYIYIMSGSNKPIKRLWTSSLTHEAISKAFRDLKEGENFESLYMAGFARAKADWLIGVNFTRLLTINSNSLISIGRVQTPTLAIVCKRYYDSNNFKPEAFYNVVVELRKGGKSCSVSTGINFADEEKAKEQGKAIGNKLICVKREDQVKKEIPPLPWDSTSLQIEANKKYGFSADKSLNILQILYEKYKVISYPRTASRYLANDMKEGVKEVVEKLHFFAEKPCQEILANDELRENVFNDAKLTDHHAIIPTGNVSDELTKDEKLIYDLICKGLIRALLPDCQKSHVDIYLEYPGGNFKIGGSTIIDAGWRIMDTNEEEENSENSESKFLAIIQERDVLEVGTKTIKKKFTQRPELLTQATLLEAMQKAGNKLENKELRDAIKDCGLGTGATRASIIETLFKRGYMIEEKKKLIPTDKGLSLYNALKEMKIASPELTAEWENKLIQIEENQLSHEDFMNDIIEYINLNFEEMEDVVIDSGKPLEFPCPKCGEHTVSEFENLFFCTNKECNFKFPKVFRHAKITEKIVTQLFTNGETELVKNFQSKEGKTFDAMLVLIEEGGEKKVNFKFPDRTIEGALCPKCGKPIVEFAKGFRCSDRECEFVFWTEVAKKKLDVKVLLQLLKFGRTDIIKGFTSKAGKKFDSSLIFNEKKEAVFDFETPKSKKQEDEKKDEN